MSHTPRVASREEREDAKDDVTIPRTSRLRVFAWNRRSLPRTLTL